MAAYHIALYFCVNIYICNGSLVSVGCGTAQQEAKQKKQKSGGRDGDR